MDETNEKATLTADSGWQPATSSERYRQIDILRGVALFGVLMVNLLTVFRLPLLEHILKPHAGPGEIDQFVDWLVAGVLEFKALTIFSFLFGVGIAIQVERATARNVRPHSFLARRLAWLLVLGTAHLFLVWNGDILALYAICGLLLLPFLGLPPGALYVLGVVAIALPLFIPFGLALPASVAASGQIAQARQVYGNGGFFEILRFRWHETWVVILPLLVAILPRTLGLMFLGNAVWRSGILKEPGRYRSQLWIALAITLPAAAVFTDFAGPLLLATAYTSGLLLWINPERAAAWSGLAAVGQMALTNYLVQSFVLGFVFYGYGLGLFGRIGSAAAACLGLILYAVQIQVSRIWLSRYRFGPFEWLWRSLTYGRRQPFRRGGEI